MYPITLGSAEIIVGKTQVGALYDIGCQVAITVGGSIAGTTNWATSVLSQDMTLGKKTTYEKFLQKVADSVTEQDKAAAGYSGKKYSVSATWNEDGSIATLQMKKNK